MENVHMIVKRDRSIDIAKGIAIILMVIGHCYHETNFLLKIIYAFHMPAFFIITGIIYSQRSHLPSIGKRIKSLIIPYLFFDCCYVVLLAIMRLSEGIATSIIQLQTGLRITLSFTGANACWYLPCLFIAETLLSVISRMRKFCIPIFLVSLYTIGIISPDFGGHWYVLWRSFVGLGFIAIGYYCYKSLKTTSYWFWILVTGLVFLVSGLANSSVSMITSNYGNPLLYIISSISGSFLLLFTSKHMEKLKGKTLSFIEYLGRNTLIILGTHMLVVEVIRWLDYKLFHNALYSLGIAEGIVFGSIVLTCELLIIPIVNKYFWFVIGKPRPENKPKILD